MRVICFASRFCMLAIFFIVGCDKEPDANTCLNNNWAQSKEFEIKLAVHVMESNPLLPNSTSGSQSPVDFEKMVVNGTIEKVDCSGQKTGFTNLGNSYITRGVDSYAPIAVLKAWWIGHVVYVYEFGNDKDYLSINLTVKITMMDNQSYQCKMSKMIYYSNVILVPGELYYYILLDIYSDNWVKV